MQAAHLAGQPCLNGQHQGLNRPQLPCRHALKSRSRQRRDGCAKHSAAAALPTSAAAAADAAAAQLDAFAAGVSQLGSSSTAPLDTAAHAPAVLSQQLPQALWELADAATAASDATAAAASAAVKQDWLTPVADGLETVLRTLEGGLASLHVPYSNGWSIIALTALVKLATFPFTKIQVESSLEVQKLKPQVDLIKRRYGEDKERIQRETNALYEKAGVKPLAGCLPTLATIPVFWGLFRTLTNATASGSLAEGFYFIPSLAGPSLRGGGITWLYPFQNGVPPIGWDEASRYLVLPVLLVACQYASTALITPPKTEKEKEEENATAQILVKALPLMVGWFALNLPSGLGLYYLSNTVLTTGQQVFLRKFSGAANREFNLGPVGVGQARHTGVLAEPVVPFKVNFDVPPGGMAPGPAGGTAAGSSNGSGNGAAEASAAAIGAPQSGDGAAAPEAAEGAEATEAAGGAPAGGAPADANGAAAAATAAAAGAAALQSQSFRSKRKRLELLLAGDGGAEPQSAATEKETAAVG